MLRCGRSSQSSSSSSTTELENMGVDRKTSLSFPAQQSYKMEKPSRDIRLEYKSNPFTRANCVLERRRRRVSEYKEENYAPKFRRKTREEKAPLSSSCSQRASCSLILSRVSSPLSTSGDASIDASIRKKPPFCALERQPFNLGLQYHIQF